MLLPLASVDGPAQWFHSFTQIVGNIRASGCDIAHAVAGYAHPVLGFIRPIFQSFFGVLVSALQVAAHLLAGLGREQKTGKGASSQSDEEEGNCGADVAAF